MFSFSMIEGALKSTWRILNSGYDELFESLEPDALAADSLSKPRASSGSVKKRSKKKPLLWV